MHSVRKMIIILAAAGSAFAGPHAGYSGYLDADAWTDFSGNFFTNEELDFGLKLSFSENACANIYTTVRAGSIPGGAGEPAARWGSVAFDGFDITFAVPFGEFSVGDLVYQYGKFNYYYYKRKSMITAENFTRGIRFSTGTDRVNQAVMAGVADEADVVVSHGVGTLSGDTVFVDDGIASEANGADIGGTTNLTLKDGMSVGVFYGLRADPKKGFKNSGLVYAGIEYTGAFGEAVTVKFDAGMQNFTSDDPLTPAAERATTVPLLLEPVLSFGKFTTALSVYYVIDGKETGYYPGTGEQMFAYMEPGFSFNEKIGAGLPLEIHAKGAVSAMEENGEFWAVPTFYVYPVSGMQWWTWFGAFVPFGDNDPYFGLGSEIIVEF